MRKLKYIFFGLIGLISVLISITLLFWFNLDTLFTSSNLEWAQKKYIKDVDIKWKEIGVDIDNTGLLKKRLNVNATDLCIDYQKSYICFNRLDISLNLAFYNLSKYYFSKVNVQIRKALLYRSDFSGEEGENTYVSVHEKLRILKKYYDLTLKKIPNDFKFFGEEIIFSQKDKKYNVESALESKKGEVKITSDSALFFNAFYDFSEKKTAKVFFKSKEFSMNLDTLIRINRDSIESESELYIKPGVDYEKITLNFSTIFMKSLSETELVFKKIRAKNTPYLKSLIINGITFKFKESGNSIYEASKIKLTLNSDEIVKKEKLNRRLFDHMYVLNSEGNIFEENLFFNKSKTLIQSKFILEPIKNDLLNAQGEFEFDLNRKDKKIKLHPEKINLDVKILSFKSLVNELKNSRLALPAPVNKFGGEVNFSINGSSVDEERICFPFLGEVDLSAPSKSELVLDLEGSYCLPKNQSNTVQLVTPNENETPELDLKASISKLYFALPNLDPLKGVPNFSTDSRIIIRNNKKNSKKSLVEKKKGSELKYNIVLGTKRQKVSPIQIRYKHFKPYMSINVDAKLTNSSSSYAISSDGNWAIDYLDRQIKVEKMNISQNKKNPDEIKVDVRLLHKVSVYEIYIDVEGTVEDPYVKLSSSPFLSRNDIISVLLYNRTSSELTQFESESVGNTEAAVTDRAIGLFGIWAFASTPIETVSYDPSSGVYSAQVALPGGVKFSLGTNWETVQNLSLRKRLSKSWLLVTSFDPGGIEEGEGNIFLRRDWVY